MALTYVYTRTADPESVAVVVVVVVVAYTAYGLQSVLELIGVVCFLSIETMNDVRDRESRERTRQNGYEETMSRQLHEPQRSR